MITFADDIKKDLQRKLTRKKLGKAEQRVLEDMDDIKNELSRSGDSPAKGGRWNNIYNKEYARREKGGRRSPVTLRNETNSIEKTRTITGEKGTELQFKDREKGVIFFYHDSGTARGGKFRQIYPDADSQVPKRLDETAEREVFKILDGDG